ncbi:MAG: SEC-C domain-containing protein [Anaerolineae bacterium]|nr:SEC-C domain-containing protein [Anaerolineae bacterium]
MLNEGINASERYLGRLCKSSFLSLWSYQGVFRDQNNGKEICDLLVIFGDHLLIFSDKYCEFPNTGNLQTDWHRWFKKAVLKSAKQIWGAERWLREYPDRVFLDSACTRKIPIALPSPEHMKVHRIAVAHGAGTRCRQHFGGSGSLMLNTSLIGDDHFKPFKDGGMPFAVGLIEVDKGYVHVLDDTTLDILLQTLDTTTDFIAYLDKKEHLISHHKISVAGEEELLATYFHKRNSDEDHDFLFPEGYGNIIITEGFWTEYLVSPERRALLRANQISYAWDMLIEKFSYHIARNTQYYTTYPGDVAGNELIVRFMAAEPRVRRRMLAKKLFQLAVSTPKTHKAASIFAPQNPKYPHYVFLMLPHQSDITYEEYREFRLGFLKAYCTVVKLKFPNAVDIVGIATEPQPDASSTEDALYLDARDWTNEQQAQAQNLQKELDLLITPTHSFVKEKEYPDFPNYGRNAYKHVGKIPRNAPCPCGSGKKYKHCCLRKKQ